jgi:hypothetical protein
VNSKIKLNALATDVEHQVAAGAAVTAAARKKPCSPAAAGSQPRRHKRLQSDVSEACFVSAFDARHAHNATQRVPHRFLFPNVLQHIFEVLIRPLRGPLRPGTLKP